MFRCHIPYNEYIIPSCWCLHHANPEFKSSSNISGNTFISVPVTGIAFLVVLSMVAWELSTNSTCKRRSISLSLLYIKESKYFVSWEEIYIMQVRIYKAFPLLPKWNLISYWIVAINLMIAWLSLLYLLLVEKYLYATHNWFCVDTKFHSTTPI